MHFFNSEAAISRMLCLNEVLFVPSTTFIRKKINTKELVIATRVENMPGIIR